MKIAIIGTGYVGLTTAAFLSSLGHQVVCIDKDKNKVEQLKNGEMPIYEPGLEELINNNQERLKFTTSIKKIRKCSVVFITVGTPALNDGSTDLSFIDTVVKDISDYIASYKTIVTKSTVPPGTKIRIKKELINKGVSPQNFDVVSNPEFLREGSAVSDMFHPDRTVIGVDEGDTKSLAVFNELYEGYQDTFIVTNLSGAEMIKYASNSFLATKISFSNELARICDQYGVDVEEVARGMGADPRIGEQFLQAGIGYGGSCFPKDVSSLYHAAISKEQEAPILAATQQVNNTQVNYFIEKIKVNLPDPQSNFIAVLGIAFKPNTDDIRYSRAIKLIDNLAEMGYTVHAYDPKARLPSPKNGNIIEMETVDQTINQVDAVVIATDWDEFKLMDFRKIKEKMRGKYLFDARNCLNPVDINKAGLQYIGVGRSKY